MNDTQQGKGTPDSVRVVLNGDGRWRGTFAEFVEANREGLTLQEIDQAGEAMLRGERFTFGGGSEAVFTLDRESSNEDFFRGGEWLDLVSHFHVRMLGADEIIRFGDFQLSCGQALYAGRHTCGETGRMRWHGDKHITPFFRYTRKAMCAAEAFEDVPQQVVIDAIRDQVDALAAAERDAFGAAVDAYRDAKDQDAAPERLAQLRTECDRLMEAMKYERRGLWWDAEHGTWGVGEAPWHDEDETMPSGAIYSGPHS